MSKWVEVLHNLGKPRRALKKHFVSVVEHLQFITVHGQKGKQVTPGSIHATELQNCYTGRSERRTGHPRLCPCSRIVTMGGQRGKEGTKDAVHAKQLLQNR